MKRAEYNGWLLESAAPSYFNDLPWRAWVSNRERVICGYGKGRTEAESVRRALIDAASHWAKCCDSITGLEAEYFGPMGMLATAANANSGQ